MIQVIVYKDVKGGTIIQGPADFETTLQANDWISQQRAAGGFGVEKHTEKKLLTPVIPAVYLGDVEVTAEIPAVYVDVEIPDDFTIDIQDITEKQNADKVTQAANLKKKQDAIDYVKTLDFSKVTTVAQIKTVMLKFIDIVL